MKGKFPRFYHFRLCDRDKSIRTTGGVTVFVEYLNDELLFSVAVCSVLDGYNRERGRRIASGRSVAGKTSARVLNPVEDFNVYEHSRAVARVALDHVAEEHGWLSEAQLNLSPNPKREP